MVELISKDNCQPCKATKRWLDSRGITYAESNVADTEVLDRAVRLGHMAAPVVIVGEQHWSGFRPDLLERHIAA